MAKLMRLMIRLLSLKSLIIAAVVLAIIIMVLKSLTKETFTNTFGYLEPVADSMTIQSPEFYHEDAKYTSEDYIKTNMVDFLTYKNNSTPVMSEKIKWCS